jgi:hypothetical protein
MTLSTGTGVRRPKWGAERAAARQEQYDAFVRSIGGASETHDDSATQPPGLVDGAIQEGPDDWGSDEIGAGDDDTGLVKARYFRPFATPTMPPPPSGLRVGPSLGARGTAPIGAPASGFFGAYGFFEEATRPRRPPIVLRQEPAQ